MFKYLLSGICVVFLASGCATSPKKVDPTATHITDTGYSFTFPMTGDWFEVKSGAGSYVVGQKPATDGTSRIAVVKHGPILTPGGKEMTTKEMFEDFKRGILGDSEGGRSSRVKSQFTEKKYKGAECLYVEQSGIDSGVKPSMAMTANAKICLHPTRKYQYVWMGFSERRPQAKSLNPSFESDKNRFFDSLQFRD